MARNNTKNILYIGPYREFSGAGNAARNYIQALFEYGHDICIAPIFQTGDTYPENEISSDILPLENNHLKSYDIVIQHCHPFDYVYSSKFDLNIGLYQFNSSQIHPIIPSRLEMMDKIIVNSKYNWKVLNQISRDDIISKVKIVPELININVKKYAYTEYPWLKTKSKPVVFYTIGDFIERKNIDQIIKAFIFTFSQDENVELIIKTKPHHSHHESDLINKEIDYSIDRIYKSLRMSKKTSKQPKIMVGKFEYEHVINLHQNANVYVDTSSAENFGYTTLEAALFDNYLIVNKNSSTSEISSNCYLTDSRLTNIDDSCGINFIDNTADRYWYKIDFDSLCANMRLAYLQATISPKTTHNLEQYLYNTIENFI